MIPLLGEELLLLSGRRAMVMVRVVGGSMGGGSNFCQPSMVVHEIRLCQAQFEIQDFQEFTFNPSHIPLSKHPCTHCPMDVL